MVLGFASNGVHIGVLSCFILPFALNGAPIIGGRDSFMPSGALARLKGFSRYTSYSRGFNIACQAVDFTENFYLRIDAYVTHKVQTIWQLVPYTSSSFHIISSHFRIYRVRKL